MTKLNHEIRFACDKETKELANKLKDSEFSEFKHSGFYLRVFTFGLVKLFSLNPDERISEIFKRRGGIQLE